MVTIPAFLYICRGKIREGNGIVPFSVIRNMTSEEQLKQIEAFISQVLADETEYFLVSLRIKPTNNIKVFLDGDNGLPIEKCVYLNRKLYKLLEESGMYPDGDFSLEVSSPGVDEPLKSHRQFIKNMGRKVEVLFNDETTRLGTLKLVTDQDITIEETTGKGKKAVTQDVVIPFQNIKSAVVQTPF